MKTMSGLSVNQKKQIKILIAEDVKTNQIIATRFLKKLGYEHIDIAVNGREAIKSINHTSYDIVLMDCMMPIMDGYEATLQIRKSKDLSNIIIIALTANTYDENREKCLNIGMNDYMTKPVNLKKLNNTLERWIPVVIKD